MIRALVVLAALAGALLAVDRSLADAGRRGRGETASIEALLTDAERELVGAKVAAVKLREPGAKEPLLFARVRGEWRCVSLAGAPASTHAIQRAIDELFAARGLALAERGAREAAFGLGAGDRLELSFHGTGVLTAPDADTLLAVHVGSAADGSRSFALVPARGTLLALDRDLGAPLLPRAGSGLPALLDPHVVPASWSNTARGPRHLRIERAGAPAYELELEGERWYLLEGGAERRECLPLLARGYTLFLARTPFVAVLPRSALETSGLDSPRGRVTVAPLEGEDLVLTLGDATPGGAVALHNGASGNVFAIAPELVELLLPEPAALLDAGRGNPWDAYLRER